jgi:hypothetical protein
MFVLLILLIWSYGAAISSDKKKIVVRLDYSERLQTSVKLFKIYFFVFWSL